MDAAATFFQPALRLELETVRVIEDAVAGGQIRLD